MSLQFFEKSHRYKLDGAWVPGVTTIIGVLDKPAIPKWAAEQVARHVAENPAAIEAMRPLGVETMVKALKETPWSARDKAADRGTRFHQHAAAILMGAEEDVPEDQVPLVESALRFAEQWKVEPLLVERALASRVHRYAGTVDLVAKYRHPETGEIGVGIFDWKSGKKIYTSACWQLNAYGMAEFYGLDGDEKPMAALGIETAYGIHVRSDGYDVYPLAYGPEVYREWLTIRATYDINKRAEGDWRNPGSGYVGRAIQFGESNE